MNPVVMWRHPATGRTLEVAEIQIEEDGLIKQGTLIEPLTGEQFPIREFIPRFVPPDNYANSFGEQWNHFRSTQLDRINGTTISRDRLRRTTKWPFDLQGERILEVGCGAGRFTQVLLDTGAEVHSVDISSAVDACWKNNGPHPRLNLAQADIYALPAPRDGFDKVLCFGVLQHTPDVEKAFFSLFPFVKPGGQLVIDVYIKERTWNRWNSKYLYRGLTKRLPRDLLRRFIEFYVPLWIPIDNTLSRIPYVRRVSQMLVPCWNYSDVFPLTPAMIREWAILDTFDALSPAYDQPQTMETVRSWFERAGLIDISVEKGGTGIVGRARRPPL